MKKNILTGAALTAMLLLTGCGAGGYAGASSYTGSAKVTNLMYDAPDTELKRKKVGTKKV